MGKSSTRAASALVVGAALAVALASARDYAGSWNDGSRLAAVESLVDRHTWAIDESMFVVPAGITPSPYANETDLRHYGTRDKLRIGKHFYSDKSPLPSLWLAGSYALWRAITGTTARRQPNRFCYWMTVTSSGLGYVVAVWCIFRLGGALRLAMPVRLALTASFGLATVALPYTRHVNQHMPLLAVAAALLLGLIHFAGAPRPRAAFMLGTLAGLGYGIDLGAGPLLFACTTVLALYRSPRLRTVSPLLLAALPWITLHHVLNYAIGGTIAPANTVAAYLRWPGSPFNEHTMTGVWHHSLPQAVEYGAALLVGKRGFLGHNVPLFLLVPAMAMLVRARPRELPEIIWAVTWSTSTWLLYTLTSNNSSGVCASIRWFVPLLVPGYFVIAVFVRERPAWSADFLVLSSWGGVIAVLMWWYGPWMKHLVPFYWPLQIAALMSWILCARARRHPVHAG